MLDASDVARMDLGQGLAQGLAQGQGLGLAQGLGLGGTVLSEEGGLSGSGLTTDDMVGGGIKTDVTTVDSVFVCD